MAENPDNRDIAALAKRVYELSVLKADELEARKWEAALIVNAVLSSATKDGGAQAAANKAARWGVEIAKGGFLAGLHPKWMLKTDDGKPPAIQLALESALDNTDRTLTTRLQALLFVPEDERQALQDLPRALAADAFNGAKGPAREEYLDTMRKLGGPLWFKQPWLTVLPHDGQPPPVSILIDNQGDTNDGGIFDKDPSDDYLLGWDHAIRTWNVDFLRDNPLAQLYLAAESGAKSLVEGGIGIVKVVAILGGLYLAVKLFKD